MADRPDPRTPASRSPRFSNSSNPGRRIRLPHILAASGGIVISVLLLVAVFGSTSGEPEIVLGERIHTIQMDVLNGVGRPNLAQQMTDYLRSRGFDVVEIGNFHEELEKTLVIDRTGNPQAAVQVAEALGVPMDQVMQKIDKTLYLDVSVYIGKDYQSLQPFQ